MVSFVIHNKFLLTTLEFGYKGAFETPSRGLMGAGCYGNQPCDYKVGTSSPTPPPPHLQGKNAGDYAIVY